MFKFLLEIYNYLQTKNPQNKILTDALLSADNSNMKEVALIRAMRKNCFDIVDLILELNKATVLTYDVC